MITKVAVLVAPVVKKFAGDKVWYRAVAPGKNAHSSSQCSRMSREQTEHSTSYHTTLRSSCNTVCRAAKHLAGGWCTLV